MCRYGAVRKDRHRGVSTSVSVFARKRAELGVFLPAKFVADTLRDA